MNAIIIYLLCMEWNLKIYVLNLIDEITFPCFHWPLYFQPFGFSRVPVPSNISNCHSPTIVVFYLLIVENLSLFNQTYFITMKSL